uniref:DnaJ_C domain-containing protein n=1 Tax=Caenorhabditis tropicalis TaxID=1561998 RepID=A0A1I7TLZ5_9PELO
MSDAKATTCYLNGLTLRTINEVEKILRDLPKKGDRCELQMSKPACGEIRRSTGDVIASKSLQIREEPRPFALSPPCSKSGSDSMSKLEISKKVSKSKKNSEFSCISSTQEVKKTKVETTTVSGSGATKTSSSKLQCKVLTDQVRVSPIVSYNGVVLELDVEVTIPDRNEKKTLKLEIECPDYVPSRMKIGNKWKNIV